MRKGERKGERKRERGTERYRVRDREKCQRTSDPVINCLLFIN